MKKPYLPALVLLLLAQGCGDSTSVPVPDNIVVTPSNRTLDAVGETVQYTARVENKKGKEIEGQAVVWRTTNPSVASVTSSGLVTALKGGTTSVSADVGGITGYANLTIDPVPTQISKVAGDQQPGILRQTLPIQPSVEVLDANGNPVQGRYVIFLVMAGGGTVSPGQVQTGADGRASATWQLGCSNENPQRLQAQIGGISVSFTADVDLSALAICQDQVPGGRETHPYAANLVAAGGDQGSLSWSAIGDLPPGLSLSPSGELAGTPTLAGLYEFEAQVQDAMGGFATSDYELRVCDAPVVLAPGETHSFPPADADGCGVFIPSGNNGDRYRLGVTYAKAGDGDPSDVPGVTVKMRREIGGAVSAQASSLSLSGGFQTPPPGPWIQPQNTVAFREASEIARATQEFHYRIREAEKELLESLGPNARPLPDTRSLARSFGPTLASPDKMSFTNSTDFTTCEVGESRRAVKVDENDVMVIYQDSIQRATDPLSATQAQMMLDHYAAYGPPVINGYFGGVSDINDDGKIVVFVSPVVEDGTVAFVWSGDFFPKTPQDGWGGCAASNQMEMMRFNLSTIKRIDEGDYQALGTLVHETKHISSLYKGIFRGGYQPTWIEEGTAELAEEIAARIAWAGAGGPAVGSMASAADVSAFTKENYSVILVNAGTTSYLSSQPNGVVVTPTGASEGHSVYGSGWHFHRWLGDAYGNASTPMADTTLFRSLNDSLTAAGVQGVLSVTGAASWADLMEEYLTAIMLNGTSAPVGARSFTSYNFPSMNRTFTYTDKPGGDYPWPVNVFPPTYTPPVFSSNTVIGPIGSSGIRVLDLTSDGTGLGLDVKVTVSGGSSPFRIVLLRVE